MGKDQTFNVSKLWGTSKILLVFIGLTFFAGTLRFFAALDEFWLDEIYTYNLALGLSSTFDAFTLPIDHHILNTLFMYWMGDQSNWLLYRLPAVFCGTLSVTLLGFIAFRAGLLPAVITMLIAGLSYPLIVYSSEARGYAPAIFFSLICFLLIEYNHKHRSNVAVGFFWFTAILAVLSQLLSVYVLIALGCWSVLREFREQPDTNKAIIELGKCFVVPALFCFWLYVVVISKSTNIGASATHLFEVLKSALALAIGFPENGVLSFFGALLSCIVFVYGIFLLRQKGSDAWLFYLVVILLAPAAIIMVDTRGHIFVRYFILCFPFFYLLLTNVLLSLKSVFPAGNVIVGVCLVLVLSGNAILTYQFLDKGRGHYRDKLNVMVKETRVDEINISSDHDFRNKIVLDYYAKNLNISKTMNYIPAQSQSFAEVEWFIIHTTVADYLPPGVLEINTRLFELHRSYEYGGLSGFRTALYRDAAVEF